MGECCEILCSDGVRHPAEVIGFRGSRVLAMPLVSSAGIRFGDRLQRTGNSAHMPVGSAMLGRVVNADGKPLDGMREIRIDARLPLDRSSPEPFARSIIRDPLSVGVRAIDTMLTVGRGQRIGIFGGSGVGKSTLIGIMTRNTTADVTVVGLVGERGREVREFLEDSLGEEGRKRSVVVVSTSDESPLMRLRAAMAATSTAEFYAAQGKHVLLVLDSLTRFAMAAREVGLAAGEPPATKGYPPSVFAKLARLLERAGSFHTGSITGFLHRADGRRRRAGSHRGWRALDPRRTCGAVARSGERRRVSAHRRAAFAQPPDAGGDHAAAPAARAHGFAGCLRRMRVQKTCCASARTSLVVMRSWIWPCSTGRACVRCCSRALPTGLPRWKAWTPSPGSTHSHDGTRSQAAAFARSAGTSG